MNLVIGLLLVYEWDESLPELGVFQMLVLQPLMIMASTRDEGGLGEQPPDEARERPGHHSPPKPLKTLTKVVGACNEPVERSFGNCILGILSRFPETH